MTGPVPACVDASAIASLSSGQVEDGCESHVSEDYQERGLHHCRCSRSPNGVWASMDTETFKTPDVHDDRRERQALHQARQDIAQHHGVDSILEVNAKSHIRAKAHEEPARQNSAGAADDC